MIVLSNGASYTVDHASETIRYDGNEPNLCNVGMADLAARLLLSGELIGPQLDEFAGVRGDWSEPLAPLAAMMQAACYEGLVVRYAA